MNEDKATRFHRHRRLAGVASVGITLAWLIILVATPASARVRDAAVRGAVGLGLSDDSLLVVALYVGAVSVVQQVLVLPLAMFRGLVLETRYGLSTDSRAAWLREHLKAVAAGLVLLVAGACGAYAAIRVWPERWWQVASLGVAVAMVGLGYLAPVVMLPLFHRCRPLRRESLRRRLESLVRRAGAGPLTAYEWQLGERSRRANAALVGLFGTRRVLLSDTLLDDYSDDEIEVVLAHELGHHANGDAWTAMLLEVAVVATGLHVGARLLEVLGPALRVGGAADVAGAPLIALGLAAVMLTTRPAAHALSRWHERRADRYALALTGGGDAFVAAMAKLGRQNLAEPAPSRLVRWLFYSHPPLAERIELARRSG